MFERTRHGFGSIVLLALGLAGVTIRCGGGSSSPPPPVTISISPSAPQSVNLSQTKQFTAAVSNATNTAVTWSLTGAGTISTSGLYTAPDDLPPNTSVTITATSQADASKSASVSATITSNEAVGTPTAGSLTTNTGGQIQFTVTVAGSSKDIGVTWSVNGASGGNSTVGTISSSGLYTAPSAVPNPNPVTVGATSVADPAKYAGAQITVIAPAATPTFSPAPDTYTAAQSVSLADATSGASIYYTTDGSTPTTASTPYIGAISVLNTTSNTTTIKTIATAPGYAQSAVATGAYTINPPISGWKALDNVFVGAVNTIAVDVSHVVYVTTNGGVFKSTDGGRTWISASGGLPTTVAGIGPFGSAFPYALTVDPTTAGVAYVWTGLGLYKTMNAGANWVQLGLNLPSSVEPGQIVIAPTNPNQIYASTGGASVQCSGDGGVTWSQCSNGLSGGPGGAAYVSALGVSPTNADVAYATTWRGQLFQTSDGGANWSAIGGSGIWAPGSPIYVAPSNPNVLYITNDGATFGRGTVLKSTDGGNTWSDAGAPDGRASDVGQLAISPTDPNTVYATTNLGLYKTITGGGTWNLVFAAPGAFPSVTSIALDVSRSSIYAGTPYSGFYRSGDSGSTWSQQNTGIAGATFAGLEVCSSDPTTAYAGAVGVPLMKTVDGGSTWSTIGQAFNSQILTALACNPQDPSSVLVGAEAASANVWQTTDGGATFHSVASYEPYWIAFNPTDPNLVNASIPDSLGAFLYSTDAGDTWAVPHPTYVYPGLYGFHPTLSNIVFTVGNQYTGAPVTTLNIAYSVDSGDSWTLQTFGQGAFMALAVDQTAPTTLYVGGSNSSEGSSGIYQFKVAYNGTGISSITRVPGVFNTGLLSTDIRQLVFDKTSGYLYAATGSGMFRTNNLTAGWTSLNSGLPYLSVNRIALSPDGTHLYAGTNGGIYMATVQ